jgi:hypothetical protein
MYCTALALPLSMAPGLRGNCVHRCALVVKEACTEVISEPKIQYWWREVGLMLVVQGNSRSLCTHLDALHPILLSPTPLLSGNAKSGIMCPNSGATAGALPLAAALQGTVAAELFRPRWRRWPSCLHVCEWRTHRPLSAPAVVAFLRLARCSLPCL